MYLFVSPPVWKSTQSITVQEIQLCTLSRSAKMFKVSQAHCTGPLFLIQVFSPNHLHSLPPCSARWRTTKPTRSTWDTKKDATLLQPWVSLTITIAHRNVIWQLQILSYRTFCHCLSLPLPVSSELGFIRSLILIAMGKQEKETHHGMKQKSEKQEWFNV